MKWLNNFLKRFTRTRDLSIQNFKDITSLAEMHNDLLTHLIVLARLQFVKPETIIRELKNAKANSEYLDKLIEERGKNEA